MARVMVAMSGGVDSSVAAALLHDQGHELVGVTLKLWSGDSTCCSVSDVDDARRVAHQLDIEHHVFNFGDDFISTVYEPYIEAYQKFEMPNPCIECNRHVKFDKLLRRADALGFEKIATGHHARIETDDVGHHRLRRGADDAKDQSYVLHMLESEQLDRLLLPVGSLTKDEVRAIAAERNLLTAKKPDSQNVCFIPFDGISGTSSRQTFLRQHIDLSSADLVDANSGETVGHTTAVELLSIGQRKGLGLGGHDRRRYVVDRVSETGRVLVGDLADLLVDSQPLRALKWNGPAADQLLMIQASAHGAKIPGRIEGSRLMWEEPQMKIAVGQSVVFYLGDVVLGGATAA